MLMQNESSDVWSLIDLSNPKTHVTIARNATAVIFHLKMTGWLVTRCAKLHHSPVFLVEVAHTERRLTTENIEQLSETLRVSVEFLLTETGGFENRTKIVTEYLRAEGRLSEEGVPKDNEDELLKKRFPAVVEQLNREAQARKEAEMPDGNVDIDQAVAVEHIGLNIKAILALTDRTYEQLSLEVLIPVQMLKNFASGEGKIDNDRLEKIAHALNVSPEVLSHHFTDSA